MSMIEFNHTSKYYLGSEAALDDLNLSINAGEMVFITGHSGAGKTTLLKLILRLEEPSRGQILINNQNINRLTKQNIPFLRSHIGMIFQNPHLLPRETVFNNVAMPLIIKGMRPSDLKKRVHAALDKVSLLSKVNSLPQALSTGEQQRVGIARAVVHRPPILLADEPTGNLDPELSQDIFHLFDQFNERGVTILIATHDLTLIAGSQNRTITLDHGQLVGDTHAVVEA